MSLCVCFGDHTRDFGDDLPPRSRGNGGPRKKHRVPEAPDEPLVPHAEEAAQEEAEELVQEVQPVALEANEVFKGISDGLIWNCPIGKHAEGEFSFAVVQANTMMEDFGSVNSTSSGTFVGLYDGHGGEHASHFLSQSMAPIVQQCAESNGGLTEEILSQSFEEADNQYLEVVRQNWKFKPTYATSGSCALVGIIQGSVLYVAGVGDSKAVLATSEPGTGEERRGGEGEGRGGEGVWLRAIELSEEHSASSEESRQEVLDRCPEDPGILVEKKGAWRIKGFIEVTRSLGDFYLKSQEFQCPPLYTKYRLRHEFTQPALICTPSVASVALTPHHKFVIFATDGLWDHVSNQEAVDIVQSYPRKGIARRLVKLAMLRAARRRRLSYKDIKAMRPGRRREIHDDTSVVVLYLDSVGVPRAQPLAPLSVMSCQELPPLPLSQGPGEGVGEPSSPEGEVADDFDQELEGKVQDSVTGPEMVTGQETDPATSVPQAMLPQAVLPQAVLPQEVLPQAVLPQAVLPQAVLPQAVLPQAVLPQEVLPQAEGMGSSL